MWVFVLGVLTGVAFCLALAILVVDRWSKPWG